MHVDKTTVLRCKKGVFAEPNGPRVPRWSLENRPSVLIFKNVHDPLKERASGQERVEGGTSCRCGGKTNASCRGVVGGRATSGTEIGLDRVALCRPLFDGAPVDRNNERGRGNGDHRTNSAPTSGDEPFDRLTPDRMPYSHGQLARPGRCVRRVEPVGKRATGWALYETWLIDSAGLNIRRTDARSQHRVSTQASDAAIPTASGIAVQQQQQQQLRHREDTGALLPVLTRDLSNLPTRSR
jgi:hypothetical protein